MNSIYTGFLLLIRIFQIIGTILKNAIAEGFYHTRIGRKRAAKKAKQNTNIRTTPERIRTIIEDLGPTFVKFGQILADRPDVVSDRLCYELKKLQSQAKPMQDDAAITLIEKELHLPLSSVFSDFNRNAIASASIGQVYTGTLKTGEKVIVKIQRPHIKKKIKIDLQLLRYLAKLLVKNYPELAAMNILGLIHEFGETIMKELNYYVEASNIIRFRNMFKDSTTCYIPKVYMQHTTHRLLVIEKLEGIAPDEIEKMKKAGIDPKIVAINGANALLKMILEDGFFHADPHAGNIFILPDNRVGLVDFGMVGILRPRDMMFLANFTMGFVRKNPSVICKALLTLCNVPFFDKEEEFEFDITQIMKSVAHVDIAHIDIASLMQDCVHVIAKYKLQVPSGIFMLLKSLATIEKFAMKLNPDIALMSLIIPHAKRLILARYNPKRLASAVYDTFNDYVSLIQTLPRNVMEILYKLKEGKLKHDIILEDTDGLKYIARIGKYFIVSLLLIGLFIGSCVLIVWGKDREFVTFSLIVSSVFMFILLMKVLFFKKK